jgi:hypothetical protein
MTENCKLRKAILSAFYKISQRNFGILLILWCSFKLWWNFCPDLSRSKFHSEGERSIAEFSDLLVTPSFCKILNAFRSNENESWEPRVYMRAFSTLMPRSNENKSWLDISAREAKTLVNFHQNLNQLKVDATIDNPEDMRIDSQTETQASFFLVWPGAYKWAFIDL